MKTLCPAPLIVTRLPAADKRTLLFPASYLFNHGFATDVCFVVRHLFQNYLKEVKLFPEKRRYQPPRPFSRLGQKNWI
jgi:hypothetical protein